MPPVITDGAFQRVADDIDDPGVGGKGVDRFGRFVDQNWYNTGTSSSVDEFQNGYDRDSNILYRQNAVDAVFSELNSYDSLNELASFARGTLNSTKNGITGTPSASQSWGGGEAGTVVIGGVGGEDERA